MNLPADIGNQALDQAGVEHTLGDLGEGTRTGQVVLRAYGQALRQLLRAVNWDFARAQADMVLLGDATGQTANVGNLVSSPWTYCYAYPIDCMKVRFVPWNHGQYPSIPPGNIQISSTIPLTTATGVPQNNRQHIRPARFIVATDPNYPPEPNSLFWEVQGESPQGRTVILCNVKNAQVVYTRLMIYPSVWDPLFREAMVAYLAAQIALPLAKDKKFGLQLRKENIELAKVKINAARAIDGNEGISSSDLRVDWMDTRRTGGWGGRGRGGGGYDDGGPGGYGGGFDSLALPDGSVF